MNERGSELMEASYDIVVAGGGMAGICAAVAAARHGARTALVQDRPMLGGNASSEMRVWMVGATAMGRNRYAAETGIIGELDLENLYRNPEGNPYVWDSLLLDFVLREKNITLYLNATVQEADCQEGRLRSLTIYQMTTEKRIRLRAGFFLDSTGDGRVGFLAGVPFLEGCEGRDRFKESLAPEKDEPVTLGSTLLLYTRNAGHPVVYRAPEFACPMEEIHSLITENEKPLTVETNGCDFWWVETGGRKHTIRDGDAIGFELQRLIYGIWNYIKNSGRYPAQTLELEWVGSLPARRESRRLEGMYVLKQNDILRHKKFPDAVCSGGWPIDTHPPGGIYSGKQPCTQIDAGVYQIPLRCLFAGQVENLFFAGRDLSATHLGFASARVMKTCAAMGQAAGTAAALCGKWGIGPAAMSERQISALQQTLLWDDQWIPDIWPEEGREKTPVCQLLASGHSRFENTDRDSMHRLDEELWIMLPAMPECKGLRLWMRADIASGYQVQFLCGTQRHACDDLTVLGTAQARIEERARWAEFAFDFSPPQEKELFVHLPAAAVLLAVSEYPLCGCVGSIGGRTGLRLINPCFTLVDGPDFFEPRQVLLSPDRPEAYPNQWLSERLDEAGAWLECRLSDFPEDVVWEMKAVFDPDLNRDYNQLRPDYYGNGWDRMPPQLVRDFCVLTDGGTGEWICADRQKDYHKRCFFLRLPAKTKRVRIEVESTWGSPRVSIFSLRFRRAETAAIHNEENEDENCEYKESI